MMQFCFTLLTLTITTAVGFVSAQPATSTDQRPISFGTTLDPQSVVNDSRQLAESLTDSGSQQWQAKGDQRRTYRFAEANADEPYRLCVPDNWDGSSELPLVMFLHGAGSNESTYLDMNNKQIVNLAGEHGYILVSPKGDNGAYGNFLRLSAPFGNEQGAAALMAQVTSESERTNQLSEKDVINVLELVLHEYPIDRSSMFLAGHSMGSGGTWYIGGKYREYWRGLAPMSGPFVQESGYPWDSLHQMFFFVTEGIQTPSLDGSRAVRDWMEDNDFNIEYKEVDADHGGMIRLVMPDIFDFFDRCRNTTAVVSEKREIQLTHHTVRLSANYQPPQLLRIAIPSQMHYSTGMVSIFDILGRERYSGVFTAVSGKACVKDISLPAGAYQASIRTDVWNACATFTVLR